jgi:methyl coenzyme M reductase beta subunit
MSRTRPGWPSKLMGVVHVLRTVTVTAAILAGCLATAGCVPGQMPIQTAGKTVDYEVISGTSVFANNITYMINQGEQQETKARLPWSKEFTTDGKFQAFVVNAQNAGDGSISCSIAVDGHTISFHTSSGQYAVVMCTGS